MDISDSNPGPDRLFCQVFRGLNYSIKANRGINVPILKSSTKYVNFKEAHTLIRNRRQITHTEFLTGHRETSNCKAGMMKSITFRRTFGKQRTIT